MIPTSRVNEIIDAVNRRYPKEAVNVEHGEEESLYESFWAEAEGHAERYGFWPTFEMGEIESDDPVIDIYGNDGGWSRDE